MRSLISKSSPKTFINSSSVQLQEVMLKRPGFLLSLSSSSFLNTLLTKSRYSFFLASALSGHREIASNVPLSNITSKTGREDGEEEEEEEDDDDDEESGTVMSKSANAK